MTNFKNLKIAITDNDHLKAVCDVLESMGLKRNCNLSRRNFIVAFFNNGFYCGYQNMSLFEEITLSDLLKMRDEMVKDNAKSSQE